MTSKRLKIDLSFLGANNILIYPLYSENGEKILEARTVLTTEKINDLIKKYGKVVYYNFSEEMNNIPNHRINSAYNKSKDIMEEIIRTDKISKYTYNESQRLIEMILQDLHSSETATIKLLKDFNSFDDYTYNHSVNVLLLVAVFATKLDFLTLEEKLDLTLGAYLHDIGKMKIDRQLLNKVGTLDITEMKRIKRHPQLGYELLKTIAKRSKIVLQAILFHHEKYNDKGYYGLPYNHLPIYPKIVSICDIFDALTSKRPYRDAVPPSTALKTIVNSMNVHFEYNLISNFINKMGPILNITHFFYAKHDICELNTNELALIISAGSEDILKPKVIVFCKFERAKGKINVKFYNKPLIIELHDDTSRRIINILGNNYQVNSIKDQLLERSLMMIS